MKSAEKSSFSQSRSWLKKEILLLVKNCAYGINLSFLQSKPKMTNPASLQRCLWRATSCLPCKSVCLSSALHWVCNALILVILSLKVEASTKRDSKGFTALARSSSVRGWRWGLAKVARLFWRDSLLRFPLYCFFPPFFRFLACPLPPAKIRWDWNTIAEFWTMGRGLKFEIVGFDISRPYAQSFIRKKVKAHFGVLIDLFHQLTSWSTGMAAQATELP